MKTNELSSGSIPGRTRALGACAALALALLAGACGGSVNKGPSVGSESHFLAYCSGSCAAGLDCIGGICTRSCLTEQASCSELAAGASCTNQSVEPGQVAVCDLACASNADCGALGSSFGCELGFCRTRVDTSGGSAGAGAGSAGASSGACNPVGRYQVGKEGGSLPCCPGLTELSTLVEVDESSGRRVCEPFDVRSFSCIEGSCGDGVCSEGEAPCGCGVDCPESNWRAGEATCGEFRDQSPPPDVRTITVRNTGTAPLYILRDGDCLVQPSLITVRRDGQPVLLDRIVQASFNCRPSCQTIMDLGWPYAPDAQPACPNATCPAPRVVELLPGQSREEPARMELTVEQLPRSCGANIASETLACFSRTIPQQGNYTLEVRAALLDCGVGVDCVCDPDADGVCRNDVPLATPFVITTPSSWYFQTQTVEVAAPVTEP